MRFSHSAPSMPPPPVLMFLSVCALAVLRSPHFRRLSSTLTRSDFKLHQCCLERFCGLTKARMRIAELESVAGAMRHAVKAAALVTYQADISLIYQSCPDTGFIRLIRPDMALIRP